ncbi:MAG: hybrid sensor histidine kinase/response regulator, partial [Xanthobacteraceae bacterium]
GDAVSLILSTLDRIKGILDELEDKQQESEGDDTDLIGRLGQMARQETAPPPPVIEKILPAETVSPRPDAARGEACVLDGDKAVNDAPERPATEAGDRLASHSIRVSVDTLDRLMTTVSELVLTRNQLLEIVRRHEDSDFKVPLQRLSNVTAELQEGVMKTRMQPIGNAWQKLPRIVRDLCAELGKEIELEMHGAETELDRQVLELVRDPLTHLVRNCADHGIETPAARLAAGKSRSGTIRLSACHQGGHIIIEIGDDGRGLDIARIKAKAIESGLAAEADLAGKSDADIYNFIFAAGFSTAARVTSISGRGVGMDVVRSNIEQIGGTVDLKSVAGAGTTFTIKIPLTLAIVSALVVEAAGERFAIPQVAVLELVRAGGAGSAAEHRIERIKDTPVLRLRNRLLPLLYLKEVFQLGDADRDSGFVVVIQVGNQVFGAVVDGVLHTEEIVIKPMSSKLRHIAVFSGTTILGDGSVIMIVDPNGLGQALGRAAQAQAEAIESKQSEETAADEKVALLVFRAGSQRPKAVPLPLVTRLEEIDCRRIELSDGRHLVQYRGQLMPLLRIDTDAELRSEGAQPILVFSDHGRSIGLVVDEIVDIVEDKLDVEVSGSRPGILGYAVVKGATTEMIDVGHFLPQAFEDWFRHRHAVKGAAARRVLLVDDSPFFRDMLAPLIKAAGYQVVAVSSAADALAAIKSGNAIDLVVTDIEMPDMDGFALAQAMRSVSATADIPIIGLAAMVSDETIARGRAAGFHDFVAKFDRPGLIAAIKEQSAEVTRAA